MIEKILVIDDEAGFLRILQKVLQAAGYSVATADDGRKALKTLSEQNFDVVLSDIRMSGLDGMAVLEHIKRETPQVEVILMTGHETVDLAITAMRKGAYDFLTKPFPTEKLLLLLERINQQKRVLAENTLLKEREETLASVGEARFIAFSPAMLRLFEQMKKVAVTDSPILILGESGTGKELVARAIHARSLRAQQPIVTINCSNLSNELFESEVFGHVKGAFTGAESDKKGLVQIAGGGTFFLDEVADLSGEGQAKILRLLQEHEFKRVGENFTRKSDVRIIAATNKNPETETRAGRFRLDLFYRLNTFTLEIPPLRERVEDIPHLADHFLKKFAFQHKKGFEPLSDMVLKLLRHYSWPGNIRELENACQHAVILGTPPILTLRDFPVALIQDSGELAAAFEGGGGLPGEIPARDRELMSVVDGGKTLSEKLELIERLLVERALREQGGNYSQAATRLGLSRQTLQYKLKKYGLR